MKKILFGIASVALFLLQACSDDNLPQANLSLFQLESLSATAGDESATLKWTAQEGKPAPIEYYISWTAGNLDGENGELAVNAGTNEVAIDGLENECAYTFNVQPRYAEGLAMKVSATCTPKSTRIPASNFKTMAGDKRVFISWTAPETKLDYNYKLVTESEGATEKSIDIEKTETSYLVDGLTNGTEYTFTLTCMYAHGVSPTVSDKATPGEIDPITVTSTTLRQFELCTFEYNPAYFVSGEIASVKWEFGDGEGSEQMTAFYCYPMTGTYTVTLTVTYGNGKTEHATIDITVESFAWTSVGGVGYQKSSNIVFSHDGQTLYTIPQTEKKLIAINAITGQLVWEYATSSGTYGAGPAVGADGTIYFGTEDGAGSFYAVSATGALKWKKELGAAVKASPAVTSNGMVYVLINDGRFFALEASSGVQKWSATLEGNAGGVAVDKDGTIYIGTSKGIWAYTESGSLKWTCDTPHSVTERGGSLAIHDNMLYAALKGKKGCAAIDTSNGRTLWKAATTLGDCYHPVVDAAGTVYFCEKAGYLYAVDKSGNEKWTDKTNKNYIYNGFALGANGNAYISQYASPFELLSFDATGNRASLVTIGAQTMSPVSLGPDRRLYYMTNGTITAYDLSVELAVEGWPMSGGNLQGTNSLK